MNDNMNNQNYNNGYNMNNMSNNNYNIGNNMPNNNYNPNNNDGIQNSKKASKIILAILTIGSILVVVVTLFLIWNTLFIDNVKGDIYVENVRNIMDGARDMVQMENSDFTDHNVTYYVSPKCITGKEKINSPHGDFDPAYVVIAYEEEKYLYWFIGRDIKGYGFDKLTTINDITEENLKSNVEKDSIKTDKGIGDRTKVIIIDSNCKKIESTSYKVEIGKVIKNDFDGKKAIKLYAYRDIDEDYTVTKVGIYYASNSGLGFYTNDSTDLTQDETYNLEELLKTNKTGNVSEIVAQNPTNRGDYALIYTVIKENDMLYAIPYVEAKDSTGKEYKFYGPVTATSYEQAQ